jgi:regulator of sirC expression with transglutaminase-like and TPR domain
MGRSAAPPLTTTAATPTGKRGTAGKPAQGLPDVEKSLELHPDDPDALETRGLIFEALGRKQEAIADFRRALAMAPNLRSKDALKRLGALGTP